MTIIPFLNKFNRLILNPLIILLFTLATVYFIYGIVKFLSLQEGDPARKEAKNALLWGMFGMLIMFSVYGLIRFVLATFGVSGDPTGYIFPNG